MPAYGQIKLWHDARAGLGDIGLRHLGKLLPTVEKSNYEIIDGFAGQPLPIARLYILNRSDRPGVARLPATDALTALLRYSYMARFGESGFGRGMGRHFQQSAQLVSAGMVRRLDVPIGLDRTSEISAIVEADLLSETAAQPEATSS